MIGRFFHPAPLGNDSPCSIEGLPLLHRQGRYSSQEKTCEKVNISTFRLSKNL